MSRSPASRRTPRLRLETLEDRTTPSTAYAVTDNNILFRFDTAKPVQVQSAVAVTGLAAGDALLGIDFRPATGQLYALAKSNRVYVLNPLTGAVRATKAPFNTGLNGANFGFDFDPTLDRMRVVSDTGQNLRLEPVAGGVENFDTNLSPATGVVAAAYDQNFNGTVTTTLFGIDATADTLVRIGGVNGNPPAGGGVVTSVGGLGVDAAATAGFDVTPGGSNTAFATLRVNGVS